jgi:hypothetical protein
VTKGASAFHTLALGSGAREIVVAMSGTNDADLYTLGHQLHRDEL